jgi:hypothetical protein
LLLDSPAKLINDWCIWINDAIRNGGEIVLHNAPADLDLVKLLVGQFGLREFKYRDTMQEAYGLSLPQALKALSYRLLGRRDRLSWDETVSGPSKDKLFEWLEKAFDYAHDHFSTIERRYGKKGNELKPKIHKSPEEKLFKRIYTHLYSETYNPWLKLKEGLVELIDQGRESDTIVHDLGLPPNKGIGNCSLEDAIRYGCLSKTSKVITKLGPINIGEIVDQKLKIDVKSINSNGDIEYKPIIGWIKNNNHSYRNHIQWYSIITDISRGGRWGGATRYTEDHKLLTPNGYKRIDEFRSGDELLYPMEALDSLQYQIVLGSILGDGSLGFRNTGGWANLVFSHNYRQYEYLNWKKDCLDKLVECPITKLGKRGKVKINGRWAYPSQFYSVHTIHHPEIMRLRKESYPKKGAKRIGEWIKDINPLALAIWYMDDGTILRHECKTRSTKGLAQPRFYTNSFPKNDVEKICDVLSENFGLEPSMFQMNNQWVISLLGRTCDLFFEMICQFVPPCMQYKLSERWRGKIQGIPNRIRMGMVRAKIIKEYKNQPNSRGFSKFAFCIDIADNHNFFTQNEIAHNCSDADDTLAVALEFERIRNTMFLLDHNIDDGDIDGNS